ncbi:MAG: DUF1622 domain-containing protein [Actinomycetota bacterium]|nr:DUF1622 domain-containing protein [Actinomycetota bacterium]
MASAILIVATILIAGIKAALNFKKIKDKNQIYISTRTMVGRGILLGLEILIAADIIRSVCVEFNFQNIAVLGLIIIVRVILGFTLEVEISGKWPWQQKK